MGGLLKDLEAPHTITAKFIPIMSIVVLTIKMVIQLFLYFVMEPMTTTSSFERVTERMNVAGFITEFGAMKGTTVGVDALDYVMDKADDQLQSWCYWQYKYFQDITTASPDGAESFYINGTLDVPKVTALVRTYAPTIAGTPVQHVFDPETSIFTLQFNVTADTTTQSSEIYYNPQYVYPNGISLVTNGPVKSSSSIQANGLGVVVLQNTGTVGTVSVTLSPQ